MDTRREFLAGLLMTGAATGFCSLEGSQNASTIGATKWLGGVRDPRASQEPAPGAPASGLPPADQRAREKNQKEIREKVDQLYALATDMKTEIDKTDISKVFPVTLVKRAQEIEKLAKDIKSRSKG
jgi:hypothetical protein